MTTLKKIYIQDFINPYGSGSLYQLRIVWSNGRRQFIWLQGPDPDNVKQMFVDAIDAIDEAQKNGDL